MALIGARYVVAAPVESATYGQLPTYGKGFIVGRMIQLDISPTYNSNPLYADNDIVNDDKDIATYPITIGVDEFGDGTAATHDEVKAMMTGGVKIAGSGEASTSAVAYGETPVNHRLGLGFIANGKYPKDAQGAEVPYYEATIIYQVDFANETQKTAQTKGSAITWGTETITGEGRKVAGYDSSKNMKIVERFETESAAIAFVNGKLNITATA